MTGQQKMFILLGILGFVLIVTLVVIFTAPANLAGQFSV